MANTSRQE
jgi:hypothetical protein